MRSKPRRAAVGAIAATALLFAVTACGSKSSDPVAESTAETPAESTGGDATPSPGADAPDAGETAAPADESATDTADPTPADGAVAVPEALQFTAPLVGGGTFDGAALADKPTVFWFWAPT